MPGPQNIREFLTLLQPDATGKQHGEWWSEAENYKSPNTDLLEWVLDITLKALGSSDLGSSHQEYFEKKIWTQVGQDHDAIVGVDGTGVAHFSTTMSATLRDMANFGEVLREGGFSKGAKKQVINATIVERLRNPPNKYKAQNVGTHACNNGYFSQYWNGIVSNPLLKVYNAEFFEKVPENVQRLFDLPVPPSQAPLWFGHSGVWGQLLWVFPELEMVVAKHATDEKYPYHWCDLSNAFEIAWLVLANATIGSKVDD